MTSSNDNDKSRLSTATATPIHDGIDGNCEDDDEEFADVSGEIEQYQNDGFYGVDTEPITISSSDGTLSAAAEDFSSSTKSPSAKNSLPQSGNHFEAKPATSTNDATTVVVKSSTSACSSNSVTPFHTPPSTPPFLSEASSSVSPKHAYKVGVTDDSPRFSRETAI